MDAGVANRIARLAADAPGRRVLEIGAGTGTLSVALLALGADLTIFDVDPQLVEVLTERTDLAGVTIATADALTFDYAGWAGSTPWNVAGNLPYNVATPLLIALAQLAHPPDRIVAMIQKDVADRLVAAPATASYGSLTVAIGVAMRVERAFDVGPGHFYPRLQRDVDGRRAAAARAARSSRSGIGCASNRSCAAHSRTAARRSPTRSRSRSTSREKELPRRCAPSI